MFRAALCYCFVDERCDILNEHMYDDEITYLYDDPDDGPEGHSLAHGVELARKLLAFMAAREEGVFSDVSYHDSALLRTGRQALEDMRDARTKHEAYLQDEITKLSTREPAPLEFGSGTGTPYRGESWKPLSKRREEHPFDDFGARRAHEKLEQMHELSCVLTSQERASRRVYDILHAKMFYTQACFMKAFVDDYARPSIFARYFPTYNDMSDHDLRAYFTWRHRFVQYCEDLDGPSKSVGAQPATAKSAVTKPTAVKHQRPLAQLSFSFVYAYELLCNVHAFSPEKTFEQLKRLRDAYADDTCGKQLSRYLTMWMLDYAMYNNLSQDVYADAVQTDELLLYQGVACLRRFEHAIIVAAQKQSKTRGKKLNDPAIIDALCLRLDVAKLADLLVRVSDSPLKHSKVYEQYPQRLQTAVARVFVQMVLHCQQCRKQGFMESLFGNPEELPYTMFESAVFYETEPHDDQRIQTPWYTVYSCSRNRWTKLVPCTNPSVSSQLANILRGIERAFCEDMPGFVPPPHKSLALYQKKFIHDTVQHIQTRIKQYEARQKATRVTIDSAKLGSIRAAAAVTCEALLVDEERDAIAERDAAEKPFGADQSNIDDAQEACDLRRVANVQNSADPRDQTGPQDQTGPLTAFQQELLEAVVEGCDLPALPPTTMLSIEVDTINEAFFDQLGDSVLTMDDTDGVHLVEDYRDEVEEFLRGSK